MITRVPRRRHRGSNGRVRNRRRLSTRTRAGTFWHFQLARGCVKRRARARHGLFVEITRLHLRTLPLVSCFFWFFNSPLLLSSFLFPFPNPPLHFFKHARRQSLSLPGCTAEGKYRRRRRRESTAREELWGSSLIVQVIRFSWRCEILSVRA